MLLIYNISSTSSQEFKGRGAPAWPAMDAFFEEDERPDRYPSLFVALIVSALLLTCMANEMRGSILGVCDSRMSNIVQ